MSRPHRRHLACIALCSALLLAGAAGAEPGRSLPGGFDFGWNALQAGLGLRATAPPVHEHGDATRLGPVGARAISPGIAGIKLWASGAGYAVGRRSAGYGVQGGASLALNETVDLTASYRLTGFALGDRLDPELADVQSRNGAPFLGLDVEF